MDAAAIVKRIRASGGINRKELAELADVSPSTISRIERGALDPTRGILSRILEATGFQISGDTIVSAGDTAAILAARSVLQGDLYRDPRDASEIEVETARWLQRWERAGWLARNADVDDMLAIAISAGNAAKISRRDVARRFITAELDGETWHVG